MNKTSYMQIDLVELGKQLEAGNTENLFIEIDVGLICCVGYKAPIDSIANKKWFLRCEQEDEFECRPEVSE